MANEEEGQNSNSESMSPPGEVWPKPGMWEDGEDREDREDEKDEGGMVFSVILYVLAGAFMLAGLVRVKQAGEWDFALWPALIALVLVWMGRVLDLLHRIAGNMEEK